MISSLLEMERWAVVVVVGWVLRGGDEGMGERMRQSKRNSEGKNGPIPFYVVEY